MRQTFTLLVEFRGDLRGREQRKVAEDIKAFAEQQDFQTFGYESGDSGTYAFMAHPDLIDLRRDSYEVGAFRRVLELWIKQQKDIQSYTLQAITEVSQLFPRIGDRQGETSENLSSKDKFFKAIRN